MFVVCYSGWLFNTRKISAHHNIGDRISRQSTQLVCVDIFSSCSHKWWLEKRIDVTLFIAWCVLYSGSSQWQGCVRDFSGSWLQLARQRHLIWRLVALCAVGLMCLSQTFRRTLCQPSLLTMVSRWPTFMHSWQVSRFLNHILKLCVTNPNCLWYNCFTLSQWS